MTTSIQALLHVFVWHNFNQSSSELAAGDVVKGKFKNTTAILSLKLKTN